MNINNINNGDTGFIAKTKINTNFQNTKISIDNLDAKTVKQSLYADLPTPSAGNNRHYYQTEQGIYKSNGSAWIKVGYTLADLDALLNTKANQSTTYTQAETNTLLDSKQANITASNGVQKVGVDVRGVDATTSAKGVVQLSNTYNGNSQILATTEKALSDGLAIKQNAITTGTTAQYFKGNLSLSNFATDAQNAVVEDAINNEVTNKAPSQNAVFDALALKAPLASPTFTGSVKVPTPLLDSEAVPKSYADGLQRVLSAFGRTGVVTAQSGDYSATQIINTPAGNISATSVQAAINELDNEKQANIGYTPENVANKENITLDTSSTKYPTNNLVKTYTDAKVEDQIIDGVTTKAPSQNVVFDALALKAPLSSPALTGTPTAPTASVGTNTTQIATTQYVKSALLALTKSDVGLSNVQNIDTTNPANIIQSSTYKFVTDTEKDTWNEKISSSAIKNTKTLYVSGGVNGIGSDANNGFSELSALNTLATANGKADGSGWAIKQLPTQLTESVTFTHPNLEFLGTTHRDNSGTTGTITSNPSSGSQTYSTYSFTNFSKLGSGYCILTDVSIKTALNDTGSGDIDIINSALSTALLTFTGSGAKRLYNCRGGSPVVNNASAFVYIVNNQSVANPILTAGTLALENCIVYVTQGATLTLGTAGSTISLNNVRFIYPDSTEATINIPTGVIYSFAGNNLYKSTSTINGTDISLLSSNYIHNVKINTLNLPNRTASQRLETDANKNVVSVAKGTADNQNYSTTVSDIKANGAGSLGLLSTLPRADHIHPTDTTREATANKVSAFTGTPNNTNYPTEKLVKDSLDSKLNSSLKGAANGLAELGSDLKVPISQLPTFLTLGETSSTAYAGDKGKIAYDHSQIIAGNPHNTSKADIGLNNVDNTSDINKPISTATQNALNAKQSLDATLTALSNLNSAPGIVSQTGVDTFTKRTIVGSNGISITNGDGAGDNPTIALTYGSSANTVAQGNDARLGTKDIDETNIGNGKILVYNSTSNKREYISLPTTDLSVGNITSTTLDIISSTGIDATITQATITQAGLMNATDKVNVNKLATGTTLDKIAVNTVTVADNGKIPQVNSSGNISFVSSSSLTQNLIASYTSAERDSLSWVSGNIIYNTTYFRLEKYNGTSWVSTDGSVGMLAFFDSIIQPLHYQVANGSQVSRTGVYSELWTLNTSVNPSLTASTFTITIANPAVITKTAHGLTNSQRVRFTTTGALPTGITTGVDYVVTVINVNTFKLSTTIANALAGTYITTSGTQSGIHSYTNTLYGQGNGTTTQNVPDARGLFLRGVDSSRLINTQLFSSNGSIQADGLEAHTHPSTSDVDIVSPTSLNGVSLIDVAGSGGISPNVANTMIYLNTLVTGVNIGSVNETRPNNYSSTIYIKYL